ncbi:MAG: AtpZ/AtpI family protein [Phycisphaerae bacterium]|jgi:F0F1-type ATP synthase assembly protein I
MADKRKGYPDWIRSYGIGFEFVAAVAVFAFIGYLIDRKFGSSPWGVLVGLALGLIGGGYNLIKDSLAAFRRFPPVHHREDHPTEQGQGAKRDEPDDKASPNGP